MSTKRMAKRAKAAPKKKAAKKAAKKDNKKAVDKGVEAEKARGELYAKIARGEYTLEDKFEVMKLQKLYHQKEGLGANLVTLKTKFDALQSTVQVAEQTFQAEIMKTITRLGLASYHGIRLDDERPGFVFVDEKTKQQAEAMQAAVDRAADKAPEPASKE